ncbi:MAG TPA: hemerythrin domain-containing protein [Pedomonas sp.]|uniref:hemerythrin domain-containing protein n=1 Tax=Pedomonas sp. TaxID=2976421 RepID=UPI002F4288FA
MTPTDETSSRRGQTRARSGSKSASASRTGTSGSAGRSAGGRSAGSQAADTQSGSKSGGARGGRTAASKSAGKSTGKSASGSSGTKSSARQRAASSAGVSKSASGAAASRSASSGAKTGAARGRPAGGAKAKGGGKDAVAFLKQDHRTVEQLFSQFEEASDGRTRASIMRKIAQALTVHAQIEEELFYPAARQEMGDHDLLNEAQVEHDSVKKLIAEIESMRPSEQLYKAKVTVLQEYVKHHVKEEERELFPEVKKTSLDLEAMGEELAARHQQLMRGGAGAARGAGAGAGAGRGRGRGGRTTAETGLQMRG